jgi:hypothetical protein
MKIVRMYAAVALAVLALPACKDRAEEAREAAQKEADLEAKRKEVPAGPAVTQAAPVQGRKRVLCDKLINPSKFTTALGETGPLGLIDVSSGNGEATATCSLIRAGTPPSAAEQAAILKKKPRLGVLPGDEVCRVAAYCWTLESEERLRKRCSDLKNHDDDSMGSYACVQIVPTGIDDVKAFRFFDEDTRCIIDVKGGPSMVDNDLISKCARTARDTIGTEQLVPDESAEPGK